MGGRRKRAPRRACICALLLAAGASGPAALAAASAAPPPLTSDRPDRTDSPVVLPPGFVQLELGWSHTELGVEVGDLSAEAFPETLVRVGLVRGIELRLSTGGHLSTETRDAGGTSRDADGWTDGFVGAKFALAAERGARPRTALIAGLRVPVGQEPFSTDAFDPALTLAFSNTLSERFALGYNAGVEWLTLEDLLQDEDTLSLLRLSASLSYAAAPRLGVFLELFGTRGLSATDASAVSAHGGAVLRLRDNLQVDATVGAGLDDVAPDWFATAGLVYRLPR